MNVHLGHDASATGIRRDIQGLRALAVALVVLFHVSPDLVPGGYVGVDVFFVISGFLITGMLIREIERTGSLSLTAFYARRIRRLLPAATSVLIAVGLITLVILPQIRWKDTAKELVASALYGENIWLRLNSIDYLSKDVPPSPIQHYWSLSIEEQYYILWPALLLVVLRLSSKRSSINSIFGVASLLFAASLAYSIVATLANQEAAYFATAARLWELALGGLVALLLLRIETRVSRSAEWLHAVGGLANRFPLPGQAGVALAALGIGGILVAALSYTRQTNFPGAAALLPTFATALIIIAGSSAIFARSLSVLNFQPFQYLGTVSYSLYLWHWPVIIFFGLFVDREPSLLDGLIIIAVSIGLAHVTKTLIEDPFRYKFAAQNFARTLVYGGTFTAACLTLATIEFGYVRQREQGLLAMPRDDDQHPGALVLTEHRQYKSDFTAAFTPDALIARRDNPAIYKQGCQVSPTSSDLHECEFGDKNGERRVALVGDSHAAQWLPALQQLARKYKFKIVTQTKSSCAFIDSDKRYDDANTIASSCYEWNNKVVQNIIDQRPDLVITSMIYDYAKLDPKSVRLRLIEQSERLEKAWLKLTSRGVSILAIRATPGFNFDVPDCLSRNALDVQKCAAPRDLAVSATDPITIAASRSPDVTLADLNDFICLADRCEPIVGNVLVYRDRHHLTATYAETLASALEPFLLNAWRRPVPSKTVRTGWPTTAPTSASGRSGGNH